MVSRYVDEIARRASGPALQKALALARARKWTEIESAVRAGFAPVRLGPRVLRTETAGIVALAVLQALWGDLQ